jgi:hypothetical protein
MSMTAERIIELSMDQFTDGEIDLGNIVVDEIVLLLVHCNSRDAWYRVDMLLPDAGTPPELRFYGPCSTKEEALTGGAGAAH